MIKLIWTLIVLNLMAIILHNIFIVSGAFPRERYDFGAHATVVTCILVSIYTLRNMHSIKWFGTSVESGHPANVTVSKVFALLCLVPAVFINLYPIVIWSET